MELNQLFIFQQGDFHAICRRIDNQFFVHVSVVYPAIPAPCLPAAGTPSHNFLYTEGTLITKPYTCYYILAYILRDVRICSEVNRKSGKGPVCPEPYFFFL
jgi:hypothetical protein